jgi:hypothetical protein
MAGEGRHELHCQFYVGSDADVCWRNSDQPHLVPNCIAVRQIRFQTHFQHISFSPANQIGRISVGRGFGFGAESTIGNIPQFSQDRIIYKGLGQVEDAEFLNQLTK